MLVLSFSLSPSLFHFYCLVRKCWVTEHLCHFIPERIIVEQNVKLVLRSVFLIRAFWLSPLNSVTLRYWFLCNSHYIKTLLKWMRLFNRSCLMVKNNVKLWVLKDVVQSMNCSSPPQASNPFHHPIKSILLKVLSSSVGWSMAGFGGQHLLDCEEFVCRGQTPDSPLGAFQQYITSRTLDSLCCKQTEDCGLVLILGLIPWFAILTNGGSVKQ